MQTQSEVEEVEWAFNEKKPHDPARLKKLILDPALVEFDTEHEIFRWREWSAVTDYEPACNDAYRTVSTTLPSNRRRECGLRATTTTYNGGRSPLTSLSNMTHHLLVLIRSSLSSCNTNSVSERISALDTQTDISLVLPNAGDKL